MIGIAAPTYFLAPRGGWIQPVPLIASYADYVSISDFNLRTTFYDEEFIRNIKNRTVVGFELLFPRELPAWH